MSVEDLVQWLTAQLDVDEQKARETADEYGAVWAANEPMEGVQSDAGADVVAEPNSPYAYIAEWDPARVLREIAANRRRLARHAPQMNVGVDSDENDPSTYVPACSTCQVTVVHPGDWPCEELRDMLVSYADRPGYREEWAP